MTYSNNKATLKNCVSMTILASALLFASPASAQLEQQTGIADPGRIDRTFGEEKLVPQAGPDIRIKKMSLLKAPKGAENIRFNFGGLRLEGVGMYSESELTPLYQSMIGSEISLADLYAIANQMTLKYRNDGFVLTQVVVPPQTIEGGIARLQVVEGFVDKVILQGGERK